MRRADVSFTAMPQKRTKIQDGGCGREGEFELQSRDLNEERPRHSTRTPIIERHKMRFSTSSTRAHEDERIVLCRQRGETST